MLTYARERGIVRALHRYDVRVLFKPSSHTYSLRVRLRPRWAPTGASTIVSNALIPVNRGRESMLAEVRRWWWCASLS